MLIIFPEGMYVSRRKLIVGFKLTSYEIAGR